MMKHFFEIATAKSFSMFLLKRFIIDVWYVSKYTLEVVQDSIAKLKWMSAKMLEKTFFTENLLRTGFERRILQNLANQHPYHKEIS